ncbi:MAG: efflux RND transporter periplasmic adaptor subunit [Gammaproteobacteria bacterium]|nr:MAG: efflux RND transporter periplasmic adaptor subunit [Gammaproteobacteria bacterium]
MKQFLEQHVISILLGAVLIALTVAVLWRLQEDGNQGGGGRGGGGPVPVVTSEVVTAPFVDTLQAVGSTRANESIEITANISDRIERILFREGEQVEAGQLLVVMNSAEERAQLAEALANLSDQRQQFERLDRLVATNSAALSQRDEQKARLEASEARVGAIRARLEEREIRAPFAGQLGLRQVSPGARIASGTMITTLDDVQPIKLDFSVPEGFLSVLHEGASIRGRTAAWPDQVFEGKVIQISPRVDPLTRSVAIRAEIPNDARQLRPGMLMLVDLVRDERTGLMVPESALSPRGDDQFVFRIRDGHAELVRVTVGSRLPGVAEITSGLSAGDVVVAEGGLRLRSGSEVRVQREIDTLALLPDRSANADTEVGG